MMQVVFGEGAVLTGGAFSLDEMEYHNNATELLTAKFSLKTFVQISEAHSKFLSDNTNTTTVNDINNIHSNKSKLCHSILGLG